MSTFGWTNVFTNNTVSRLDFVTNIRARIDEDEPDVITDNQLFQFINQGLWDINFRTKLLPEYSEVTLGSGRVYTLPVDMTELYEVVHIQTGSTPNLYRILTSTNYAEIEERGIYQGDIIDYYIRNGNQIEIIGNLSIGGRLRAYGSRIPTLPTVNTHYIDLPNIYIELLYMWCEWKFFARRREPDEESVKRDLYLARCEQVQSQVESQYARGLSLYG